MIITEWQMYWITRLDGISTFFAVMAVFIWGIGGFVALCLLCGFIAKKMKERKKVLMVLTISTWIFMESIFITGNILIPSTKAMVAILAIPAISRSEDIQEIPGNMAKLINKNLIEWMKSISPVQGGSDGNSEVP